MGITVGKILGGMSTAGLILAGTLPLMAEPGWTGCSADPMLNRTKSAEAKDTSAAKKTGDNAKTKAPADKAKAQQSKVEVTGARCAARIGSRPGQRDGASQPGGGAMIDHGIDNTYGFAPLPSVAVTT
jgi:hypothetical protein